MSSPTPEPVARTSSYGTPSPSENNNDERLPPRPVAHGAAVAADAACPREHTLLVKRTLGVSHSSSAGVVQANVGQKLIKSNILRVLSYRS